LAITTVDLCARQYKREPERVKAPPGSKWLHGYSPEPPETVGKDNFIKDILSFIDLKSENPNI